MKINGLFCVLMSFAVSTAFAEAPLKAALFLDAPLAKKESFSVHLAEALQEAPKCGCREATPDLTAFFEEMLTENGYATVILDAEMLCTPGYLEEAQVSLLVLPYAKRLPMKAIPTVTAYLEQGGNLLVLNGPAWVEPVAALDGKWQTPEEYRMQQAQRPVTHHILDFNKESIESWYRSAYRPESPTTFTMVKEGPVVHSAALEVHIPELEGWDSVCRTFETSPFPEGFTDMVFSARGGAKTNLLAVEWSEEDGSRWLAVVPLTTNWQQFRLSPESFKFWESVPSRAPTTFNPAQARMIAFTLAYSHTGHMTGEHWFQVSEVGAEKAGGETTVLSEEIPLPPLDIVAPSYKFFDMKGVTSLCAAKGQQMLDQQHFLLPKKMQSVHPRPEAGGFAKGRPWRWIPLLEARAADGDLRGYPAAMLIHGDGKYQGGIWASFAIDDGGWYESEEASAAILSVLARMKEPVFLMDGGAAYYTCFEDQEVALGATVVNLKEDAASDLSVSVTVQDGDGNTVGSASWSDVTLSGTESKSFVNTWVPPNTSTDGFQVITRLLRGEALLDYAEHELYVWKPKENPSFVSIEDGDFVLEGKRWRPHGVNYMPSSGIGIEWSHYFEHWIGAEAYHPKVIQRDLERCAAMGCNAVSIFIYRKSMEAQNLLDLLRRIDLLGMKANLSLRPGTPMDLQKEGLRDLIGYYRLAENDTVYAYDLAWEPQFRQQERDPFNPQWEAWIIERYGSVEAAEEDWGCSVARDDEGAIIGYRQEMITGGDEWAPMIAAYRRFLDTLLYEKYGEARRFVRSLDPNHAVSFRMSMAGDPTDQNYSTILYDFAYLAGAVDILEPEAYGRIGNWEKVKPGWFTYEYGRWANPALPVMWAEAGVHVWDMAQMQPGKDALAFQAKYYTDFYRMLIESGADGIFWWWYPGGYRTNEKSDYGVINPDGTDRPVTAVIRNHANAFIDGPDAKEVDHMLYFDRDSHKNGLTGIYNDLEASFWKAIGARKTPGLNTEGSGTDSTNCPLMAVGNRPQTKHNPPKYLDAFFDRVEIQQKDGSWRRLLSGDRVAVDRSDVQLRFSFTNLGEAALVAPHNGDGKDGVVFITCSGDLETAYALPLSLTRFEEGQLQIGLSAIPKDQACQCVFSFDAHNRCAFGSKFELVFTPPKPSY